MDLSRAPLPLIVSHDSSQTPVGIVECLRVVDRKLRGLLRFGNSTRACEVWADVQSGIIRNLSIGYQILKKQVDGDVYRAVKWVPFEVSLVAVPADNSVGIGRSYESEKNMTIENENENKRPREIRRAAAREAKDEIMEFLALGERFGMTKEANQAIREGVPLETFRTQVMDAVERRNANPPSQDAFTFGVDRGLGMSRGEISSYSVMNLLRVAAYPNEPKFRQMAGLELDVSDAETKRLQGDGISTKGYRIPIDVTNSWQTRTLTAGTATDGAELVGTNLLAGSFIDVLRNRAICLAMGARVMTNLVGNVSIPRKTSGSVWAWLANEGDNVGNSEAQFDSLTLTPKTGGAYTDLSRNLLLQGTPDAEQLIRDDLAQAAATGIDLACLYGSGASGQPTGIANVTGINAPTAFAAATPTWAEVVAMKSSVAVDNALWEAWGTS
ncbi:phage major capsid protein [Desulfosarcina cetonica]|uniref:phage major capsid protein n=1 Tax=Desulfosarcina cetonica TaxID=90730 RepID=UPI00248D0044|nr:phage major capsid protein [Desulfosarcina cetonica]